MTSGSEKINAVVLGATGYVGGELLRLISAHPAMQLTAAVSASRTGQAVAATFPNLAAAYGDAQFAAPGGWIDSVETGRAVPGRRAPHHKPTRIRRELRSGNRPMSRRHAP